MNDIGAEVGQKMRSAIKAKLMELDCYVDEELPDYIMVMVANKRTKSQMNNDLELFLRSKTSSFVDWLHIVLKKLKEVHVTNPEVYRKVTKRKAEDMPVVKVKKEKTKSSKKSKDKGRAGSASPPKKCLTDDLPVCANKLSEMRKIVVMQENKNAQTHPELLNEDSFDIPLLSEVANLDNEAELEGIEKRIKHVKSRLGMMVESDSDEDFINIKADPDDMFPNEKNVQENNKGRTITIEVPNNSRSFTPEPEKLSSPDNGTAVNSKSKHNRIIYEKNVESHKKPSILERLGKRTNTGSSEPPSSKKSKIVLSETLRAEQEIMGMKKNIIKNIQRKEDQKALNLKRNKETIVDARLKLEKNRDSILSRLGVMSKVSIPKKSQKPVEECIVEMEEEEENFNKEVPSVVKIKPRILPPVEKQANKNLLLKAVADAQRSVAQTPTVGSNTKPDALFTKKYKEKRQEAMKSKSDETTSKNNKIKLPEKEKNKIRNLLSNITSEEKKTVEEDSYTPPLSNKTDSLDSSDFDQMSQKSLKQQFIVTLDGIDKEKYNKLVKLDEDKPKKRAPSPIVFDQVHTSIKIKHNVPDELPKIQPPVTIKNKERCKYWPSCRQGAKCEFVHPSSSCKAFPLCKFGDKCLFIHPTCKFELSCTKKDCPYSHVVASHKAVASRVIPPSTPIQIAKTSLQTCKFYPQCTNPHCTFYHPRPCKFGKYCKNQGECNFSHGFVPRSNLTWRSDSQV